MHSLIAIMLLVLPVIDTYPTSCKVNLPIAQGDEIRGEYITEGWMIAFCTVLKDGTIHAATTFKNTTTSGETEEEEKRLEFVTQLTFQDPGGRMIPGIEKQIIEAALDIAQGTNCNLIHN